VYIGPRDEEPDQRDAELLRYERERRERARRRDAVSWRIIAWVMAAALALLSYDSGGAAVDAHRAGRPWLYPATVSAAGALGLLALVAWALRRR
jgi:fatty acid desaturase